MRSSTSETLSRPDHSSNARLEPEGDADMLTVGDRLPAFKLQAVVGTKPGAEFTEITGESHPDQWKVLFFWPMDFTFVCPTEIAAFGKRERDFKDRDAP